MRRVTTIAAALLAGALVADRLWRQQRRSSDRQRRRQRSASSSAAKSDLKVGLAYDIGGRGDQSFNDAAAAGLDKAKADSASTAKEAEASNGETDSAKEERLRALASAGYNPVIAVGFAYSGAVAKVAKELPDTQFAIIDDAAAVGDNIANLLFAEEQGSFLVGAAAALKTQDQQRRLRRRRRRPADPQVRGRLRGRRQGRQPGRQGPGQVPHPAAGLLRLR